MNTSPAHETHLVIDKASGRISEISPLVSELLGFDPAELIGRHHSCLNAAGRFAAQTVPWDAFQEFAYVAVHDLRSPMRRVSTLAGMLKGALGDQIQGQAAILLDQLMQATVPSSELIKQLQVFAEALGPPFPGERVELNAALRAAMQRRRSEIDSAKAEVVAEKLPAVKGESSFLEIVFENLVSNAIRFRSPKPPRIEIAAIRDNPCWNISVKDNGTGIDAAAIGRLFHPFRRMHRQSGTGLGLAICHRIVQRAGGDIWIDNSSEDGTTVMMALRPAD